MACRFCHREGTSFDGADIDAKFLLDVVGRMYELGFRKFKLMGGEPMLYPQIGYVVSELRRLIGDSDLSMISNGSAASAQYEELFVLGMDRLNISVHGWGAEFFSMNTKCPAEMGNKIRQTIIELAEKRRIGKLNYVVKRGGNEEDFISLLNFARERDLVVDALNLLELTGGEIGDGIRYSMSEIQSLICSRFEVLEAIEIQHKYGFPSKRLRLVGGGEVNLKVSQLNQAMVFNACSDCRKWKYCVEGIKALRLMPSGVLQPCLMREDNVLDLNQYPTLNALEVYLKAL